MSTSIPLDRSEILQHAGLSNLQVEVFEALPSTNSWLLANPPDVGVASLCIAESQTAGRGRRGNQWLSKPGQNIMLSLGWCFTSWPQGITGLSLAVGMLVAEQLNRDCGLDVKVKWPNDLMVADRKLGGILIELAGESSGNCQVVIGLGLNVYQPDWSVDQGGYAWQDLHGLGISIDRNEFVGRLLRELTSLLSVFEEHGFTRLSSEWPNYSSYQGRKISVVEGEQITVGQMTGVDKNGALLVTDEQGEQHIFTDSNVSVRLEG